MSDDTSSVNAEPTSVCEHPEPPTTPAARAEWFAAMLRTHVVSKCPDCHLLRVWTTKRLTDSTPVTLGEFRRLTASLPDTAVVVLETAESDTPTTYERAALMLAVKAYGNAYTVNLCDTPSGAA